MVNKERKEQKKLRKQKNEYIIQKLTLKRMWEDKYATQELKWKKFTNIAWLSKNSVFHHWKWTKYGQSINPEQSM